MNARASHICVRAALRAATLLGALAAVGAHAQGVPLITGTSTIATGAGSNVTGVLSINETAGLNNGQDNQLTISIGSNGGAAATSSLQSAIASAKTGDTVARIEGSAFSNLSGALMVNQSAGVGNLQRNSTVIGMLGAGVRAVSDTELSEAAPGHGGQGLPVGVHETHMVSISNDAFKHISGIVQVNQTSGAGNATANSFVLRPPAGTFFN